MAASSAILGKGTILATCATSSGSYVDIAEVKDVGAPDPTPSEADATHYLSQDDYMEPLASFIDGGEVSFELNFTKAQQTTLEGYRGAGRWWKVTLVDGSTYVFPGWLKKLTVKPAMKDVVTASASIRVTGLHTFTAAA